MYERRSEIEQALGDELTWERLDNRRASRIALYRTGRINDEPDALQEYQEWLIANLLKLKETVLPRLEELVAGAVSPDGSDPSVETGWKRAVTHEEDGHGTS